MERERKVQRKALSMKRATKKTQGKTRALDSQTSSQVNLRIAVSQMNFVVGDFKYNANRVENRLKEASKFGTDLILFPELTLTGYPPEDLLLKDDFIAKQKASKASCIRCERNCRCCWLCGKSKTEFI